MDSSPRRHLLCRLALAASTLAAVCCALVLVGVHAEWFALQTETVLLALAAAASLVTLGAVSAGSAPPGHAENRDAILADLNRSNQLLERIFSNIHVLVAYLDADFNFIRVNDNYAAADQRTADFFVGKNHFQLYPNEENEEIFRRVAETGEPYVAYARPFEYAAHPERGVSYWDWSLFPIKDGAGKVEGLVLSLADVTERKRLEEERLASEAKFRTVFDNAGDAILIFDPATGKFSEVNRVACERLGYSHEEMVALGPQDIDPPRFAARVGERVAALLAQGHLTFETAHVTRGGREIPVELSSRLVELQGRTLILSIARDISQRKEAQQALQESERKSRALLNATTETAMLLDPNGAVLATNEIGAQRLGRTAAELVGMDLFELMPPPVAERRKAAMEQVLRTGQPVHFRDERDGLYFQIGLFPVLDAQGTVTQVAVYAADVTERVQLQALDKLLHEIDQAVLRGQSLVTLLKLACSEMAQLFGYPFVWIGKKEPDGGVSISAWAGPAAGYQAELEKVGVRWDDTPSGRGPVGTAVRTGRFQVFQRTDPGYSPWRKAAEANHLAAVMSLPLIIRGEVYGALTLYSAHPQGFSDPLVIERMAGVANRICVALEMAMDQQQLRLLSTALAAAANGVFITDIHGQIQWMNAAFTRLAGYTAKEALGKNPRFLKSGRQDKGFYRRLWQTILKDEVWTNEVVERRKDGTLFTVKETITPIRAEDGEITHFISILEDITAQKAVEARMEHMAHYDALTDLPNRALFYDRLRQVLARAKRGGHAAALLFIDLDRFKEINDTLGHHIGDLLLQGVAKRLKTCVRESDTVARLAGDEFVVLLPQVAGREDAAVVARKILAALTPLFHVDGQHLDIGGSIGIALYPEDATDDDTLVKNADTAMYVSKQKGRNTFSHYGE